MTPEVPLAVVGVVMLALASGALLAACMPAALTASQGGWRKPEVLLGMAAILTLVASNLVLPGKGELYFAGAAATLGFASVVLSLRSVISDIPADRGQTS